MTNSSQLKTKHIFIIFLAFSTLWDPGYPKRVRLSSSVSLSICEQHAKFAESGEIQTPIKERPPSHTIPCSWYRHPQCSTPDEPDSCTVVQKPCDGEGKKGRTVSEAGASTTAVAITGDINDIDTDFQEDEFGVKQGRFLGGLIAGAIGAAAAVVGGAVAIGAGIVGAAVGTAVGVIHNIVTIKAAILQQVTGHIGGSLDHIVDKKEKILDGIIEKIKWLVTKIRDLVGQLIVDPVELLRCIIKLICTVVDKWTKGNGVLTALSGEIGKTIKNDVQWIVNKIVALKPKTILIPLIILRAIRKKCRKIVDAIIAIKKALIAAITTKLTSLINLIIELKQKIIDAIVEKLKWLCTLIFDAAGGVIVSITAIIGAVFDLICHIIDKLLNLGGAFLNVFWALLVYLKEKIVWLVNKIIEVKGDIIKLIAFIGEIIAYIIESKLELIGAVGEAFKGCFEIQCLSCKDCGHCPLKPTYIKCKKALGCGTFYNADGTVDRGCFHRYWKKPGCYNDFTKCHFCNPDPGHGGNTTYCKCNTDKCNDKCEEGGGGGGGDPDQP